jgi:hypothetical protein
MAGSTLTIRNLEAIRQKDPQLGQAFDDVLAMIQTTSQQANVTPSGNAIAPPPNVSSLQVTSANGAFSAAIIDNNPVVRGINYFLEYSPTPAFNAPIVIDLGASRNWEGVLGNRILYWRAYSSYPTSARSTPVYFGSQAAPTAVTGGGTISPPASLPSQGSGTSSGASGSDGGFGNNPKRGDRPVTQGPYR